MGVRRVHDLLAGTVRQFRLLSSGRLVTTGYRCAPSHRPYEHLLLIAGTYTPVSFALTPFWRDSIIAGMWICTTVALIIHVIWISAPRWLYVLVYIIFGVSGVAFMGLFWMSPYAGPTVVILLCAGGACYIAGAIVYALRKPDPWPKVFGFHEIFHTGTVAGYACHMVAIYMVIVQLWP